MKKNLILQFYHKCSTLTHLKKEAESSSVPSSSPLLLIPPYLVRVSPSFTSFLPLILTRVLILLFPSSLPSSPLSLSPLHFLLVYSLLPTSHLLSSLLVSLSAPPSCTITASSWSAPCCHWPYPCWLPWRPAQQQGCQGCQVCTCVYMQYMLFICCCCCCCCCLFTRLSILRYPWDARQRRSWRRERRERTLRYPTHMLIRVVEVQRRHIDPSKDCLDTNQTVLLSSLWK